MDVLEKLDSAVVKALLVALVGLIGVILSYFGVDEAAFGAKAGRLVDAVVILLSVGGVAWGMWARINKPNPNLSQAANEKEKELVKSGELPAHMATAGVVTAVEAERSA